MTSSGCGLKANRTDRKIRIEALLQFIEFHEDLPGTAIFTNNSLGIVIFVEQSRETILSIPRFPNAARSMM